ncbi:MAG TPA: hypothetical protein HA230_00800 [Candidatus Aenigmarchaeota archaeon]|nr:hypothetical protein [Candidatus Aenigmarchaeota archaeon]
MLVTLCAYCEKEYRKGERHDVGYLSDYTLENFLYGSIKCQIMEKIIVHLTAYV